MTHQSMPMLDMTLLPGRYPPRRGLTVACLARLACLIAFLAVGGCAHPPVTGSAPDGNDSAPKCAPTNRYALYQHIETRPSASHPTGIYVVHFDSLSTRLIAAGLFNGYDWIPGTDSLIVAFAGRILQISQVTGTGNVIATHEAFNTVSASGRYVAFDAGVSGRSNVLLLDRQTSAITDITPDSMLYEDPDWSPTDNELVALGSTPTADGVFRLSSSGAPIKQLTSSVGGDRQPTWSPAGDQIAWVNVHGRGALLPVDTTGSNRQQLAEAFDGVSWTSGGRALIYTAQTSVGVRLFEYNLDTHNVRQITF